MKRMIMYLYLSQNLQLTIQLTHHQLQYQIMKNICFLWFIMAFMVIIFPVSSLSFLQLNQEIETLNTDYMSHFSQFYNSQALKSLNKTQQGQYLYLLGKMYLYGMIEDNNGPRYLFAYFYLRIAAEMKQNAQAYYYLAVMQFYRLIPESVVGSNIEDLADNSGELQQWKQYLKNSHLHQVESSLYMSSLLGHNGASTILGNLNKQGIGMQKNCSTAVGYFLYAIKNANVDVYEFRKNARDYTSFEKELYSKTQLSFDSIGEDISVIQESLFFDDETIETNYQIGHHYLKGSNGYIRNFTKAAQIFTKLSDNGHKPSRSMLGTFYLQGHGVQVDYEQARRLFTQSKNIDLSDFMLISMDYFGIGGPKKKESAIARLLQKERDQRSKLDLMFKYLFGSIIVKGEVTNRKMEEGLQMIDDAAARGSSMAAMIMGLIFTDGSFVNYDCWRATRYFAQELADSSFFLDKHHMAKLSIKKKIMSFALIKYLQLTLVGDENAFINAIYMINMYGSESLSLHQYSWSIQKAVNDQNYQLLRKLKIIPQMSSFILKTLRVSAVFTDNQPQINKLINLNNLGRLLETNKFGEQKEYIRYKIITVGSKTKGNSLLKYYQYQASPSLKLLKSIANDNVNSDKLHVIQARYLLGRYYQSLDQQRTIINEDGNETIANTSSSSKRMAIQHYKLATKSQIFANILYVIEGGKYQLQILDDFMTYVFMISVIFSLFYIKKTRRLNEILTEEMRKNQINEPPQQQPNLMREEPTITELREQQN